MDALMKNPAMLGGAVVLVVVLLVVILKVMKGKGDAAPAPAAGGAKSTNIAAKGAEAAPAKSNVAAKPAGGAPAGGADPFKDEPDPRLVTQYQEGTGEGIEEIEARLKEDPKNEDLLDWLAF